MKSPLIGGIGVTMIIGSILGLYYTYTDPISGGEYLILWTLLTLAGLYISIYQFTSFFIEIAKRNKSYYYRRLLFLTSLDYKFKQLTSILMLVTVMIMVTILYSTIILFTYMLTEQQAINGNPYDIAFIQTENKNNLDKEELYSIIDQKDNPVQKHLVVPIYSYYQKQTYSNWTNVYNFMSLDQFNKFTSSEMKLKDKEYLYYIDGDPKNTDGSEYYQSNVFPFTDGRQSFTLKEIIVENNINFLSNIQDIIILSNSQFEQLKISLDGFESNIHLINVIDWKRRLMLLENWEKDLKSTMKIPRQLLIFGLRTLQKNFYFRLHLK